MTAPVTLPLPCSKSALIFSSMVIHQGRRLLSSYNPLQVSAFLLALLLTIGRASCRRARREPGVLEHGRNSRSIDARLHGHPLLGQIDVDLRLRIDRMDRLGDAPGAAAARHVVDLELHGTL